MTHDSSFSLGRRRLLQGRLAASAAAGVSLPHCAAAQGTRNADKVRIGWGPGGLPLLARERGEFEKNLTTKGIKVEWVGPFPNHAPSLQARRSSRTSSAPPTGCRHALSCRRKSTLPIIPSGGNAPSCRGNRPGADAAPFPARAFHVQRSPSSPWRQRPGVRTARCRLENAA